MLSFGVSNLRRLKLIPPVALKPITLLVGRNSSGKSSFLRAFPLMRQSLMTRTSSPILWFGDLVDFGSFKISSSNNSTSEPISFSFVLDKLQDEGASYRWYSPFGSEGTSYSGIHYDVSIVADGDRTRISRIFIRINNPKISYEIVANSESNIVSLKCDGVEYKDILLPNRLAISPGTLLPEMVTIQKADAKEATFFYGLDEFAKRIITLLPGSEKRAGGIPTEMLVVDLLLRGAETPESILAHLASRRFGPEWSEVVRVGFAEDDSSQLRSLLKVGALPVILSRIRSHLRAVITSTLYIGPARARSERYYRYQDLAVSEIDPDGKNFPMFLNSLSRIQIQELSKWIESLFGYGLHVSREGGHMTIDLEMRGATSNIVDTGYGVSQILPVLGQIWWARTKLRQRERTPLALIAIEQPELHLHPAHQAYLADAFVSELSSNEPGDMTSGVRFLIETHSETLLNRLGQLIAQGKIANDDVQVLLFEAVDDERLTDVITSSFTESGELVDWPYGFFQPND